MATCSLLQRRVSPNVKKPRKSVVLLADASEQYLEEFIRTKKTGSQEIVYHRYILTYLKDHDLVTSLDLIYRL